MSLTRNFVIWQFQGKNTKDGVYKSNNWNNLLMHQSKACEYAYTGLLDSITTDNGDYYFDILSMSMIVRIDSFISDNIPIRRIIKNT